MITLVGIVHVFVCLLLIGAVLLQGGENVDITAVFGGTS
jgi:preprotein translocase subunit SecG